MSLKLERGSLRGSWQRFHDACLQLRKSISGYLTILFGYGTPMGMNPALTRRGIPRPHLLEKSGRTRAGSEGHQEMQLRESTPHWPCMQ